MSSHTHNPSAAASGRHIEFAEHSEASAELLEYWRSITKRKWPILGFTLAAAVVATAISFALTPVYKSTNTMLIESTKAKVLSVEEVYSGISANREYFETQKEIISSKEVAVKTIKALQLWNYAEFDPRKKKGLIDSILGGDVDGAQAWTEDRLANAVYGKFAKSLTIELVRLSQLVKISFESSDPQLAALVANKVGEVYVDSDREARFGMTQGANQWLNGRLESLRAKLDTSEKALQAFREKEGIIALKSDAQGGASNQIADVTSMLVSARMRRAEAENAYKQVKSVRNGDYRSVPSVVNNSLVMDALRSESEAERAVSDLSQRYGPEHPKMVQAEAQLKSAREITQRQIQTVVSSLTQAYEVAAGTERSLEQSLNQARGSVVDLNRKEVQLGALEREVNANRQLFDMFMNRAKQTGASDDLQSAVARSVDPARIQGTPIKPQKPQIVAIAALLALLLGASVSLLLDRLDNRLNSTDEVERKLKFPLLTGVPLFAKSTRQESAYLVEKEPKSIYSEAVFTARTGILLSSIDLSHRTILVTSSVPAEGKTTFSLNLALAMSHTRKTLLIDADMRRPTVAKSMELDMLRPGLSQLVAGTAKLDECIQVTGESGLHVIAAGAIPPNPLEILLSNRFKEMLSGLSEQYDMILIDSPPVDLVSDSLVIAPLCSNTIFVTKSDATPYQLARKSLLRLNAAGANILGVALSHLDFERAERYYGQTSTYGSYGAGYYGAAYGGRTYGADTKTS
ncbi:polysaccharide biosynthesis tyrosine autokinase [Burkholderiaceae bacterium DAT-1]|nr:polysaccharide biosynthesis tyrosine autokinase [Burkholderiaceae bacterium DAT-1]